MTRLRCLKPRLETPANPGGWKPDAQRGSRHERGYGWEWEKTRARILERDERLCQPGLAKGEVHVATEVDHRVPKAQGGTDDDRNLQAICTACHRVKTSTESGGGGSR